MALGLLGETLDNDKRQAYGINATYGVLIMSITRSSVADQAGIQAGDVVTAVNGEKVKTDEELQSIIADHKVGDVLAFDIMRGENSGTIRLKLPPTSK